MTKGKWVRFYWRRKRHRIVAFNPLVIMIACDKSDEGRDFRSVAEITDSPPEDQKCKKCKALKK